MTQEAEPKEPAATTDFAKQADQAEPGFFREYFDFLRHEGKWWMLPLLIVLLLIAVLIVASSSVIAPFIYTLF